MSKNLSQKQRASILDANQQMEHRVFLHQLSTSTFGHQLGDMRASQLVDKSSNLRYLFLLSKLDLFLERYKIKAIREKRNDITKSLPEHTPTQEVRCYKTELTEVSPIFEVEVHKLILKRPSKHCELDPIPTWLLRKCLDVLLTLITCIVNSSLTSATMPYDQMFAIIKPLLKKHGMDLVFPNFRPVSNLSFISKLIERFVVSQTKDHVMVDDLHDPSNQLRKKGTQLRQLCSEC